MNDIYVSDFETTVRDGFACVWLYANVSIYDTENIAHGYSIQEYMEHIFELEPKIVYFHNLKFDGMYIIDWLLRNGFTHTEEKKMRSVEFKTLIGEEGQVYSITIRTDKRKIQFWDSLKIFNFSVEEIANSFKLPMSKGTIDYDAPRPHGYIPTKEEIYYVDKDVLIVAKALKMFIDEGYTKMTIASNALKEFKDTVPKKEWQYLFPILNPEIDGFCRKSYKGGFTYVNPRYQNRTLGRGCVYDMNSMYPYTLYYKSMPVGLPHYFAGSPPQNKLYIIKIHCDRIYVKENHIPTIQIKGSFRFNETDYLTDAYDVDLHLTSVDYELFKDHYNHDNLVEISGYWFESRDDLFREYIDKFMEQKRNSKGGKRQIAKLFLNGLYGKFGSKIDKITKIPYLDKEENIIKFRRTPPQQTDPIYIPVASFVTAYARDNIIRNAQRNYDRFIYCDTDSLHLLGTEIPDIPIHDTELGYYKCEGVFRKSRFIRPKTYTEVTRFEKKYCSLKYGNKIVTNNIKSILYKDEIKCCGMSKNIVKSGAVTFDNFVEGAEYEGKLKPKIIPGGVVLVAIPFTIKKSATA